MTYEERRELARKVDASPIIGAPCGECGGPCLVPAWVLNAGGQNYPNAPERQRMALSKGHRWVTAERLQSVILERAGV